MGSRTETIRVLHVDDAPAFVDMAATFLEREDDRIEVITATNADEGLQILDEAAIDCVVSDYDMPGLNGVEFLERVRETYGDCPFVLFTGKGSEEVASEAISAGVTDYVQKSPESEQYEILINRIVNAVDAARFRERAARQEHINTLIREINRRLVAAETVDDIEHAVCRTLADATPFRFAWIGEPDADSPRIVPRTSVGDADDYLDEVTLYYDDSPRGRGPGGRAIRTGELQVAQRIRDDPTFEPWHEVADRYGYESVAVVPLSYGGGQTGMLAIYAGHPDAFDEIELSVLEELGETISRALQAAEIRQRLESRQAAETTQTERNYRTLIDALPNGAIALFDTDLHYTVVGGAVFGQLSLSPAEMEGRSLTAVHSATFRDAYLDHYRAALDGERRSFEFTYGDRTFEAHVAPVRNEDGAVVGGLAMSQDVTDRIRREDELERRERVLREMYEAVSDPSLSITEGIQELLRIGADALGVQYGVLGQIDGDDLVLELTDRADGRELGDGDPAEGDAVPRDVTYCERVVRNTETVAVGDVSEDPEFSARPPYTEGGFSCYVGAPVVVDGDVYGTCCFYGEDARPADFSEWEVTLVDLLCRWVGAALDRRETNARLRAQNERFREFTSIVTHDLRNPLGVLGGALELAEMTGEKKQFDRCRRALARMDALVDDLSTLTREGAVVDGTEPLALGRIARECWSTVETDGAELRIDDDATIRADENRLRQLLENLFRNSVEHGSTTPRSNTRGDSVEHGSTDSRPEADDSVEHGATNSEGSGPETDTADPLTIRVGTLSTDDGFYVEDNGMGIPEERQGDVFEQGYSTATSGTGLGLSIVEKMAAAHGWTVTVTEGREGGARIEVRGVERV
ncbi:GAF domain-containing protein [Haloplanus aerogenes]|uniref:histidine kinase n=1 Tax=Haloplanus aerogenes TaxID=660522 RepID=A0A3M0CW70_9EURY|nr:GAF domain-containing protein [Haloplanus aerogenes]AZH24030.1 response regulator [Haloplanus aerogenes]RMB13197.1 PAS domain S-box-containing protein [Haloplanus aerogenes]